jgi:hypothetical protein
MLARVHVAGHLSQPYEVVVPATVTDPESGGDESTLDGGQWSMLTVSKVWD